MAQYMGLEAPKASFFFAYFNRASISTDCNCNYSN